MLIYVLMNGLSVSHFIFSIERDSCTLSYLAKTHDKTRQDMDTQTCKILKSYDTDMSWAWKVNYYFLLNDKTKYNFLKIH